MLWPPRARVPFGLLLGVGAATACGPAPRDGACQDALIAGDLVITEVFADYQAAGGGPGADAGQEWFEIYNAAGRPLELRGLTVVHGRPDGSRRKSHVVGDVAIAPGQLLTMGNAAPDQLPAHVDHGYGPELGDLFNSDAGRIALRCGDAEIDAAIYEGVRPGRSRQLTAAQPPDYTLNDDPASWCEAADTEFEPGNFGTPRQDNDCTPVIAGRCSDGGAARDAVAPGPGDLVITEIMPSPSAVADAAGEWFEARAMKDLDLNGVGLDRAGDTTAKPDLIEAAACLRVPAGAHVVFARSGDPARNGGLIAAGTFRFALVAGSAAAPGDVRILSGAAIVDAVTWTSSRSARSLSLDPDQTSDTANDDPANFCDGDPVYHAAGANQDRGTPGAPNPRCPLRPPPGHCLEGGAPRAIVRPAAGQLVITEYLANPAGTGTDAAQEWFELTNTGAAAFDLNGLGLRGNAATVNVITSADCKRVAPGGFALLARGTDPATNGGLPAVDATFSFALAQSHGSLTVLDGAAVVDAITWTTGIQDGASRQLRPELTSAAANDDPASSCDARPGQVYGTAANLGTPKAANACR